MPSYDIATAAFAAGATRKWVDNLVSHHALHGIEHARRGVERRFSIDAVIVLRLVRTLHVELGMSLARAVEVASSCLRADNGAFALADGLLLTIDLEAAAKEARHRIVEAAESIPRVRRGRPPRQRLVPDEF